MTKENSVPRDPPICLLECAESFERLTSDEKRYTHHIGRASFEGFPICLAQTSEESLDIFRMILHIFSTCSFEDFRARAVKLGVTDDEVTCLLEYFAYFLGNGGNYLNFGDSKFVPGLPMEKLDLIMADAAIDQRAREIYGRRKAKMYSLAPGERNLGIEDKGVSSYFSLDVTAKDAALVQEFLNGLGSDLAINTRLFKVGGVLEVRVASARTDIPPRDYEHKGAKIRIAHGDHAPFLARVAAELEAAAACAANDRQRACLAAYCKHFRGGDIADHKESQRQWVRDIGPVVESNIGFIETYRDPTGARAEFEGFVAIVNKAQSEKFAHLVAQAEELLKLLPWPREFEKDRFLRPDFTSLEVVAFSNSGIPAGINIPNYDDIRQDFGFKNVSLGNVLSAKARNEQVTFVDPSGPDLALFEKLRGPAFEVQVGGHELLGHGSGKMFAEAADGSGNFDRAAVKNPLTGGPITSWYKPGQTWDSQFPVIGSSYEECRAECVGLLCSLDARVLRLFGHEGQEASDVTYVNWLLMVRAGLLSMEFYKVFVRLDRSKVASVGRAAVERFLRQLQVHKCCGDFTAGKALYDKYTAVPDEYLPLRDAVLAKKQPRKIFVQCNTFLDAGGVRLATYPATAEGVVRSFVERFPSGVASA